jgi:dTDP-4-amino-4,6-dideoxygalactose transaminase
LYINWLNRKDIDFTEVEDLLQTSKDRNHYTNYGPLVSKLEAYFREILEVEPNKACILTGNGSAALHAIGHGMNRKSERKLKWATQSYTFPSSVQGPFTGSQIVDIDAKDFSLDLDQVKDKVDGIIVTNLFGLNVDIDKFESWAKERGKFLIFDNATVPMTKYKGRNSVNCGNATFISLHHTKPLGFGEGGLIICDREFEEDIRKSLNFGFDMGVWHPEGSNLRMSDVSAAFIFQHVKRNFDEYVSHHQRLYTLFLKLLKEYNLKTIPHYGDLESTFVSCFTVVFDKPVSIPQYCTAEIKKYYIPLKSTKNAKDLYKRILCIPCHIELDEITLTKIIKEIQK